MSKYDKIAKKFLLYFFSALVLMVVIVVAFDDGSSTIKKESNDVLVEKKNETRYTACECADISYKVVKDGGVDSSLDEDINILDICNKMAENEVFLSRMMDCESYKLMGEYFKNSFEADEALELQSLGDCLVGYDWCSPNCNNPIAAWRFSADGIFNYSNSSFGGIKASGSWKDIGSNQIELIYTNTSTGDVLPNAILSMPDCRSLSIGATLYNR